MNPSTRLLPLLAVLILGTSASLAEKGDRNKPMVVTSDHGGQGNLATNRSELTGDVVLTQGTMLLRAEKVDLRQTEDGYYLAYASGQAGKPVSFRQARDTPGEFIEGSADQLEYDTRADTVRFVGKAVVRHLRGSLVAHEVTGAAIVFDKRTEVFALEGGATSPNPSGRTRLVLMPRAGAASAPEADAPLPLRPSSALPQDPPPPRK